MIFNGELDLKVKSHTVAVGTAECHTEDGTIYQSESLIVFPDIFIKMCVCCQ